jgi:hypothetical protein
MQKKLNGACKYGTKQPDEPGSDYRRIILIIMSTAWSAEYPPLCATQSDRITRSHIPNGE